MNKAANQEDNFDMFGFEGVSLADIDKLLDDEESKVRWPEMMLTIFESLKDECSKLGLDEIVALVLLARLCKDTGGLQYYFPKGEQLEHQLRCMYIWREFNGQNVPELAIKYNLSTQNIYAAIRRMRNLEVRKRQHQLF
ncbi:TPA: positive regulator of late transcription [Vibrio cholerae]|nr:positive regulator of late transcription [Vibrio cholerae]